MKKQINEEKDNKIDNNEEVKLPGFNDIDQSKIDNNDDNKPAEPVDQTPKKSLIGMLLNKKYSNLKDDVQEIIAKKIADKIQDKKDQLKSTGFRSVTSN